MEEESGRVKGHTEIWLIREHRRGAPRASSLSPCERVVFEHPVGLEQIVPVPEIPKVVRPNVLEVHARPNIETWGGKRFDAISK